MNNRLQERLAEIERLRAFGDSGRLEAEYLALLGQHDSREERARIYTAIAVTYANDGMQEPAKVVFYSREALNQGVDLVTACRLHIYWGEALEIMRPEAPGNLSAMREVLRPYLDGLKLTVEPSVDGLIREIPPVGKVDHDGQPSEEGRRVAEIHEKEVELRARIELQNDVLRFRRVLVDKCASLFAKARQFTEELKGFAEEIVESKEIVADILRQSKSS